MQEPTSFYQHFDKIQQSLIIGQKFIIHVCTAKKCFFNILDFMFNMFYRFIISKAKW